VRGLTATSDRIAQHRKQSGDQSSATCDPYFMVPTPTASTASARLLNTVWAAATEPHRHAKQSRVHSPCALPQSAKDPEPAGPLTGHCGTCAAQGEPLPPPSWEVTDAPFDEKRVSLLPQ
jgi:hypothetical protein